MKEKQVFADVNFEKNEQEIHELKITEEKNEISPFIRKKSLNRASSYKNNKSPEKSSLGKLDRKTTLNQQHCEVKTNDRKFKLKKKNRIFLS